MLARVGGAPHDLIPPRRRTVRAAPRTRAHSDRAAEELRQVRLVAKPAIKRNLSERLVCPENEVLRMLDPSADQIRKGCFSNRGPKCPREMGQAEPSDGGEIVDFDLLRKVALDETDHSRDLPGSERRTIGSCGLNTHVHDVRLYLQERCGLCNAEVSFTLVAPYSPAGLGEETDSGSQHY